MTICIQHCSCVQWEHRCEAVVLLYKLWWSHFAWRWCRFDWSNTISEFVSVRDVHPVTTETNGGGSAGHVCTRALVLRCGLNCAVQVHQSNWVHFILLSLSLWSVEPLLFHSLISTLLLHLFFIQTDFWSHMRHPLSVRVFSCGVQGYHTVVFGTTSEGFLTQHPHLKCNSTLHRSTPHSLADV